MLVDSLPRLWQLIAVASATGLLYAVALALYRLTLHPLASFPGPKIAAVTRFYEAYWDVVRNGQYTFQIARLHKKYGSHSMLDLLKATSGWPRKKRLTYDVFQVRLFV